MSKVDFCNDSRMTGLVGMFEDIHVMLVDIVKGFNAHRLANLESARKVGKAIHDKEVALTSLIVESVKDGNEFDRVIVPFPSYIERMSDNLESIINSTQIKIKEGMLFSEKAAGELNHIFDKTSELIMCIKDAITTRNSVLLNHIVEKGAEYYDTANEYALEHEERLVNGVCLPRFSSMYLDILDSLKEILRYIRDMGKSLSVVCD